MTDDTTKAEALAASLSDAEHYAASLAAVAIPLEMTPAHAHRVATLLRSLAARVREIEGAGWQPIETAPEDSDPMLVFWRDPDGAEQHDFDYREDGCWMRWNDHAEHTEVIGGWGVSYTPPYTHFRPIYAPPSQQKDQTNG